MGIRFCGGYTENEAGVESTSTEGERNMPQWFDFPKKPKVLFGVLAVNVLFLLVAIANRRKFIFIPPSIQLFALGLILLQWQEKKRNRILALLSMLLSIISFLIVVISFSISEGLFD
jgi:hypothetical protein